MSWISFIMEQVIIGDGYTLAVWSKPESELKEGVSGAAALAGK